MFIVGKVLQVVGWQSRGWLGVYRPCLARAAVTSCASVASCGDSSWLRLPAEERRGEVPPSSPAGEWVTTISAPWSTRAFAVSRNVSLWLSICRSEREGGEVGGRGRLVGRGTVSKKRHSVTSGKIKRERQLERQRVHKESFNMFGF